MVSWFATIRLKQAIIFWLFEVCKKREQSDACISSAERKHTRT